MRQSTEVEKLIAEIRRLVAESAKWCEDNEDICGYDDALWFDTIADFDQRIAEAGIQLADAIEGKPQVANPE